MSINIVEYRQKTPHAASDAAFQNDTGRLFPPRRRSKFSFCERVRYRLGETGLRAPFIWWRHRGLQANDVFIAAYPRSGYTWLRFLLFEIITGRSAQFREVDAAIPYVTRHRQGSPLLPGGGRLIATHETYRAEYRRAIYITRDVRDVALSEFFRERAKGLVKDFDEYLVRFLAGSKRHGAWVDHLASWLDSDIARSGNLLVIRYEDLHRRPLETLESVTKFLHVKADGDRIATAIAGNTVEQMRIKEDASGSTFQGEGQTGSFVREGAIGGWRGLLDKREAGCIEIHAEVGLLRMNYPVSSRAEAVADIGQADAANCLS